MRQMSAPIAHRYDFVYLFDVTDGNPNGDPDAGNQPRMDPETGEGLVTDVCLKRKIRNIIPLLVNVPGYRIYFQTTDAADGERVLNRLHQEALEATSSEPVEQSKSKKKANKGEKSSAATAEARRWMCEQFWDIRAFGAVMTTGVNCGQVRGPVQLTFARSVGRILALEHTITRKAVTTEDEAADQIERNGGIIGTMGRKMTVPYGLYRCHGFISPQLAGQTGFSETDLSLLWTSLQRMFELDRTAARGQMAARGLYVFKHKAALGNAPSHRLQGLIRVTPRSEVTRSFDDFVVEIETSRLPAGVELISVDCDSFTEFGGPEVIGRIAA